MSQYKYSLSTYFAGGVNTTQLYLIIRAVLRSKILSVYINDNFVYVVMNSDLTPTEKTTLDNLILSYVYSEELYQENDLYIIEPAVIYPTTSTNGYTRISTFRYPGSVYQTINKIVMKSWVDSGRTYNIKVQNYDTGAIIYESSNLTNTVLDTLSFTSGFTNIPTTEQYVNVLVKLNGASASKKVYVEYIGIHLSQ